jgi:SNF2 family DNA or RNA helicase
MEWLDLSPNCDQGRIFDKLYASKRRLTLDPSTSHQFLIGINKCSIPISADLSNCSITIVMDFGIVLLWIGSNLHQQLSTISGVAEEIIENSRNYPCSNDNPNQPTCLDNCPCKPRFGCKLKRSVTRELLNACSMGYLSIRFSHSRRENFGTAYPFLRMYLSTELLQQGLVHISADLMSFIIAWTPTEAIGALDKTLQWVNYGFPLPSSDTATYSAKLNEAYMNHMLDRITYRAVDHLRNVQPQELTQLSDILSSSGIVTSLRRYQLEGVWWLEQELRVSTPQANRFPLINDVEDTLNNVSNKPCFDGWIPLVCPQLFDSMDSDIYPWPLHSLSAPVTKPDFFYNMTTGAVTIQLPMDEPLEQLSQGAAILADSMGLGKSIQVLALIVYLKHLSPNSSYSGHSLSQLLQPSVQRLHSENRQQCICCKARKSEWIQCDICSSWHHGCCVGTCDDGTVTCIRCLCRYFEQHPLMSNTSLLVLPDNLVHQWMHEIKKHFSPDYQLKVFIYYGCNETSLKANSYASVSPRGWNAFSPIQLATFDIIVAPLSILRKEFHLSNVASRDKHSSRSSNASNASAAYFPPPLLGIYFNLVVVDETQKLETVTRNQYLCLLEKIHSSRRLSVSGTPMGHLNVTDLKSLAIFLRIPPFYDRDPRSALWDSLFMKPKLPISSLKQFSLLCDIFGRKTLRRTRDTVGDQMEVPEKKNIVKFLQLSGFETALYSEYKEKVLCEARGTNTIAGKDSSPLEHEDSGRESDTNDDTKRERMSADAMKAHFELLRKGCCHPQVFDKTIRLGKNSPEGNILGGSNRLRSFNEIIVLKVEQVRNLCEERLRELLYHLFSMAGADMINYDISGEAAIIIRALASYMLAESYFQRGSAGSPLLTLVTLQELSSSADCAYVGPKSATSDDLKLLWVSTSRAFSPLETAHAADFEPSNVCHGSRLAFSDPRFFAVGMQFYSDHIIQSIISVVFDCSRMKDLILAHLPENKTGIILFPSEIRVDVQDGMNMFSKSIHLELEPPQLPDDIAIISNIRIEMHPIRSDATSGDSEYRSKSWRVCCLSAHEGRYLLVERKENQLHYSFPSAPLTAFCRGQLPEYLNEMLFFVGMSLEFGETSYDIDRFQQMHMAHNINIANDLLPQTSFDYTSARLHLLDKISPESISKFNEHIKDVLSTLSDIADDNLADIVVISTYFDKIRSRLTKLETKLLLQSESRSSLAFLAMQSSLSATRDAVQSVVEASGTRDWWKKLLQFARSSSVNVKVTSLEYELLFLIHQSIDQGEMAYEKFKSIRELAGVSFYLNSEFVRIEEARVKAIKAVKTFVSLPIEAEIIEGSDCKVCRSYHDKTGPMCGHCKIAGILDEFADSLTAYRNTTKKRTTIASTVARTSSLEDADFDLDEDVPIVTHREFEVDGFYPMIMKVLNGFLQRHKHFEEFRDICRLELEYCQKLKDEVRLMRDAWNRRLELLKVHDEIRQSKQRIQAEGNLSLFELDEISSSSYYAAVAADTEFRKSLSNLQFYKNQIKESDRLVRHRDDSAKVNNTGQEEDYVCCICREDMVDPKFGAVVYPPCCHAVHKDCLDLWLKNKNIKLCPTCKQSFKSSELVPVSYKRSQSNAIDNRGADRSSNPLLRRIASVNNFEIKESFGDHPFSGRKLERKRNFGTKIDQLIEDVLDVLADPLHQSDKMIIFSEWIEMLNIVAYALRSNKVRFEECLVRKDFKAHGPLEKFKSDPGISVLLLPIHLGAEGLDLIAASHIFLLEPLLNRAVEQQAIHRIDRIGQTRTMFIHRYVVINTVEEQIFLSAYQPSRLVEGDNSSDDLPFDDKKRAVEIASDKDVERTPKRTRIVDSVTPTREKSNLSSFDIMSMILM